jgi:Zn-dependent M16 (insulinase) family peptidase
MWRQIRGLGLSYGYSIVPRPHEALLYLSLYRSTNCVLAYKEAKNIVVSNNQV